MPPRECELCNLRRAQILRPKNHQRLCATCFIDTFEAEVAETVILSNLFSPGEKVAIGASGGKDSCVLASVLDTLNKRHDWKLDLVLLSIDEGIQGYRDHSLDAVRRNRDELRLPLKILSYQELYGWSMDQVVAQIGKKGNCTYCGVFRRQALDRGAAMLGVEHVVTGHNADDVAETVLMNLLRGDLPRLSRATSIITSTPSAIQPTTEDSTFINVKRSKPLMYAYEKEIVMYAHHKKLDYFSTECLYSPEAFRGSARTLIKNLERVRPESILDIVRSGVDMAKLVPGRAEALETKNMEAINTARAEDDAVGGCGSTGQRGDSMMAMEKQLLQNDNAVSDNLETDHTRKSTLEQTTNTVPIRLKSSRAKGGKLGTPGKQKLGQCERCGYMSSQAVCKACVLLEGLNKARPRNAIEVGDGNG